jgi:hypothetical protein
MQKKGEKEKRNQQNGSYENEEEEEEHPGLPEGALCVLEIRKMAGNPGHMNDLPTQQECEELLAKIMVRLDENLAKAERHRQCAVPLGTAIMSVPGGDGRGYIINNDIWPTMQPQYIRWEDSMETQPYLTVSPAAQHREWTKNARAVRRVLDRQLGDAYGRGAAYVPPTRVACLLHPRRRPVVHKVYAYQRGLMNRYAGDANVWRYLAMYVHARNGTDPPAEVLRVIPRHAPDRQTRTAAIDQEIARTKFNRWLRETAINHGRLNAPLPDIGVARV